ncbi:MAG: ferritin-like protein [Dehalococcoidia bacterium]
MEFERTASIEPPIVVESREELIYLLCEAAEIEHMLMCEYLFAAFSLKRSTDEGLTAEQFDAVKRWERTIARVASQEMLHLALVCNLLTAIGAGPHFRRPGFPQRARYFPPGMQVALAPFSEATLRHFIFHERPEGMEGEDSPEFAPTAEEPAPYVDGTEVVPAPQHFATVGHLYRSIEAGFDRLVQKYGERRVFLGPPEAQATRRYFGWRGLTAVTDLVSARLALDTIVEQGEGARGDWRDSHYGKFLGVLDDYLALKAADPGFEPARPVRVARVRPAVDASDPDEARIAEPITARVADLFNGAYETMLRILTRFFLQGGESEAELAALANSAVRLMVDVLRPLGQLLTTLPIGPDYPGLTAGPSFAFYRTAYTLPHREAAWALIDERMHALADAAAHARPYFGDQTAPAIALTTIEEKLRAAAAALERHLDQMAAQAS